MKDMALLIDVAEAKNKQTKDYLKSLTHEHLVYAKFKNGQMVKSIWTVEP